MFDNLNVRPDWAWADADHQLAKSIATYWTNFAKTGNPNGTGLPTWQAYAPGGAGKVMELGANIGMVAEPNRARYVFWDEAF